MKLKEPNYNNCLTNLSNSILKYYNIPTYHNSLKKLDKILAKAKKTKNIILIVYGGLGTNILKMNSDPKSFLNKHLKFTIDAVLPPTATASLTSILSGLNPNEHGYLGWTQYVKPIDKTITMFTNTSIDTNEYVGDINHKYFAYTDILSLINERVDVTRLEPFGDNAYSSLEDMQNKIISLTGSKNQKFIYAYYNEPDNTIHQNGTYTEPTKKTIEKINDLTKVLCENLDNSLVIVTSDHGLIDADAYTLSSYPDLYNMLINNISIEGRCCTFFVKPGMEKEFKKLFNANFGKDFKLYSKEEVLKKELFGMGFNHEQLSSSLGDFLAVAQTDKYFRYNDQSESFAAMHGGITEEEVSLPVIIYKTKKSFWHKSR